MRTTPTQADAERPGAAELSSWTEWTWRDRLRALLAGPSVARRLHRAGRDQLRAAEALREDLGRAAAERDALRADLDTARRDRDEARSEREALAARGAELQRRLADMADERGELAAARDALRQTGHATIVNLSLRSLTLVERQLGVIESLEAGEEDPDRLDSLFRLDHLATRMRRNSENVLVLADAAPSASGRQKHAPVPLLDALRAAVSEIEHYERVDVQFLPRVNLHGRCADDLAHLLAELLENAAAFSPPHEEVAVSGWVLDGASGSIPGEVMLCIEDRGIGLAPERLAELNEQLASGGVGQEAAEVGASRSMGLFVVARLAHRHGVRVQLREVSQGGVTAVVVLPAALLAGAGPEAAEPEPVEPAAVEHPSPGALPAGPSSAGPARVVIPGGRTPPDERPDHREPQPPPGLPRRVPMAHHLPGRLPELDADFAPHPVNGGRANGGAPGGSVDPAAAEQLRRRLGSFQHGLATGRHHAAAAPADYPDDEAALPEADAPEGPDDLHEGFSAPAGFGPPPDAVPPEPPTTATGLPVRGSAGPADPGAGPGGWGDGGPPPDDAGGGPRPRRMIDPRAFRGPGAAPPGSAPDRTDPLGEEDA